MPVWLYADLAGRLIKGLGGVLTACVSFAREKALCGRVLSALNPQSPGAFGCRGLSHSTLEVHPQASGYFVRIASLHPTLMQAPWDGMGNWKAFDTFSHISTGVGNDYAEMMSVLRWHEGESVSFDGLPMAGQLRYIFLKSLFLPQSPPHFPHRKRKDNIGWHDLTIWIIHKNLLGFSFFKSKIEICWCSNHGVCTFADQP